MTEATEFSNAAHPMAQATYADLPLVESFVVAPPYWDGYYQLRMFFTSPQNSAFETTYPSAVIKVTGSRWTLVQGGGGSCTDGHAVSVSTFYLPKSETETPRTVPLSERRSLPNYSGSTSSASESQGAGATSPSDEALAAREPAGKSHSSSGNLSAILLAIIGILVAILAAGAVVVVRRGRRSTGVA